MNTPPGANFGGVSVKTSDMLRFICLLLIGPGPFRGQWFFLIGFTLRTLRDGRPLCLRYSFMA